MAIYDIFNVESSAKEAMQPQFDFQEEDATFSKEENAEAQDSPKSSHFFSSVAARLFFFLLLLGDFLWFCYALLLLTVSLTGALLTFSKVRLFVELRSNAYLTLKRSLVCGISLVIALFSPAFGIMIACSYFLMYDRDGIAEVVPSSLQNQFKDFIQK